ncbi:hypothetical protein [Paludisphaera mucosa]|uniref:Uncharacterized protein n=1 Tax=Paludisphaera mucosa TaxID=3030827 RepID=A0ABT6F9K3_9BACT|nr:hypothetical protein [Paludisphaera mucosa]MDG3004060.1 hypothetical protein [Paludisphaera mucosa]
MNTTTTLRPERKAPSVDARGWVVLAWVAAWSAAYLYSAVGTRFPWLRSWIDGLF